MSWRGGCTATLQQTDPTSNPGLRANRARPPHWQDYHGPLRAESCTASTTAPRRLRQLGIASSPLKLRETRRPHEPKPFGPAFQHLYLLRGHAGDGPPAYLPRPLLMPQATERARNGRDEQIAALDFQLRRTLSRFCSIAWFGMPSFPSLSAQAGGTGIGR
jgi:hypothetical protein